VRRFRPITELRIPVTDGRLLADIHRSTEVLEQRHEGSDLIVRARVDATALGRLRRAGASMNDGDR
jgi:hypothetical protein